MKTAEEIRIEIMNIEDKAYNMMYYEQKLRSAKDCQRIQVAKVKDIHALLESYAEQVAKEQCGKCAFSPAPKGYHDIEEFYPNED